MRAAADFTDTTRRGTKVARGPVVLYLLRTDELCPARAGLIVGKVVGGSVERHRAARRIRGALAPLMAELYPGTRVVVRALAGADVDPGLPDSVRDALSAAEGPGRGARP
jgi:ribonuclease P protein component